jgi:hypothetical protein
MEGRINKIEKNSQFRVKAKIYQKGIKNKQNKQDVS